jgi:hypothetical protein
MRLRKKRYCTSSLLWHQSLDCHVVLTKATPQFFKLSLTLATNLPPVSLTLEANLPPVATAPAVPVPNYTAGVVDTGGAP